jgi:four helix bundle protein
MNYAEWEQTVPHEITGDSLWKMTAYRLALFLSDICWQDVSILLRHRQLHELTDQLYRATGSVSANLAEGYSRGTRADRARFYEYALGSAREGRDWYFKARHVLSQDVTSHRLQFLTEIIRLLLTMVPQQRGRILRDETAEYIVDTNDMETELNPAAMTFLHDIPFTEL